MNAEFNWWLLIVGLVIGAGLVWLILADGSRREADVTIRERAGEARWIAEELRRSGRPVDDDDVADVLDLHALYLTAPPPDEPEEDLDPRLATTEPGRRRIADWEGPARRPIEASTDEVRTADASGTGTTGEPPAVDWPRPVRTPSDRSGSDARDQPSPSRTG